MDVYHGSIMRDLIDYTLHSGPGFTEDNIEVLKILSNLINETIYASFVNHSFKHRMTERRIMYKMENSRYQHIVN